jgi:hypothetical protein
MIADEFTAKPSALAPFLPPKRNAISEPRLMECTVCAAQHPSISPEIIDQDEGNKSFEYINMPLIA